MTKRLIPLLLALLTFPLGAQNNPPETEDPNLVLFLQEEDLADRPAFETENGQLTLFGRWTSESYLAQKYIELNDYVSAKPHILEAIRIYNATEDEDIRANSVTRLYCDLADTYPIASDSVRINVAKAAAVTRNHLDTLYVRYYRARLAALNQDTETYLEQRDYCLADPQITRINPNAVLFFGLIDDVMAHRPDSLEAGVARFSRIRRMKVIANLCERYGMEDMAFRLEKVIVNKMEDAVAQMNQSHLHALDVSMGKAALNATLQEREAEISRISRTAVILIIVLLLSIILFLWLHTRNLQKTNEKVRLANEAKTRFVQNMSHEVRTPLNAIVGFSQLLSLPDGTLDPKEKEEYAGYVINSSQMLTMLLDDILNASTMDKGEYRIVYSDGDCHHICKVAMSSAEHRLQPGVKMYYAPESPAPIPLRTDLRRVEQILINLLTNACKHTDRGEIRLSSSLSEHPGLLTLAVTDTGSGVPPEDAEKIFGRFTKLNEFVQGTGLGLSICRDIATRLGGEVYLDTSYTQGGARFVLTIPLEPTNNQTNNPSA